MVAAPINHISLDDNGVAYIMGTPIKVSQIAIDRYFWQKTPEQIQSDYPQISMAQVYAALAFYCDNQDLIDAQVDEADRMAIEVSAHETTQFASDLEARLIQKINEGLPELTWKRYHDLVAKRRAETLTAKEHAELITLSDQREEANARRIAYLAQLARLRNTSLDTVMQQLGIASPGYV